MLKRIRLCRGKEETIFDYLKSKQIPPKQSTKNTILKTLIIWTSLNIRTYTHQEHTCSLNWRSNLQTERRYLHFIWPKTYMQNVNKLLQIDSRRQNNPILRRGKDLNRHLLGEEMTKRHLKRSFREMQPKLANQILLLIHQNGQNQRLTIPSVAEIVEQWKISHNWWKREIG